MNYIFVLLIKMLIVLSPKKSEMYENAIFVKGPKGGKNLATLPFQALRIVVNNELIERDNGLKIAEICFLRADAEWRLILRAWSARLRTAIRLFALNQPLNHQGRGS